MVSSQVIFLLGSDWEMEKTFDVIVNNHLKIKPIQLTYGKRVRCFGEGSYVKLVKGREMEIVDAFLGNNMELVGVMNRVDSYIPLHGMLVDRYKLFGPRYNQVMNFKDKKEMHDLMLKLGLGKYRPKTRSVLLDDLELELRSMTLPVVVKPYFGSKSRGVFVIKNEDEIKSATSKLEEHFGSVKMFRSMDSKRMVLIEEFVEGSQFTCNAFIDKNGDITIVGFEDVMRGVDTGQKHQQLCFRTTPSKVDIEIKSEVEKLLWRLLGSVGLKSTFIFPEFILKDDGSFVLIELNVRVGGFRSEMYKYAYGINLREISLSLSLGKKIKSSVGCENSCTAVEVWEDISGKIERFDFEDESKVLEYKQFFKVGEKYSAPPMGDVPLAKFFVVDDKDSLTKARRMVENIKMEIY